MPVVDHHVRREAQMGVTPHFPASAGAGRSQQVPDRKDPRMSIPPRSGDPLAAPGPTGARGRQRKAAMIVLALLVAVIAVLVAIAVF
jgi:hypothetical protein